MAKDTSPPDKKLAPKRGRNSLGRGLSALLTNDDPEEEGSNGGRLATDSATQAENAAFREIPLEAIEPNPYQPRQDFDESALEELKESILTQGIVTPITVREVEPGRYQLIAGERRTRASRLAGFATIKAHIMQANDQQMLEMAIIENIQREDLNAIEVAMGYKRLMDECELTYESVAKRVGRKRATVNNYLRLLKLPPAIQQGLRQNELSMGHARALITVEDPALQLELYRKVKQDGLSVRGVEQAVQKMRDAALAPKAKAKPTPMPDVHLKGVQTDLQQRLDAKVSLTQKANGAGEIRIPFLDTDDLNRLLEVLHGDA